MGNLGIPDILLYYAAANLAKVFRVLNTTEEVDWMTIEMSNPKGFTKQDILWLSKSRHAELQLTNRFLGITLDIWDRWKQKLVKCYSPQMTLCSIRWPTADLKLLMTTLRDKTICQLKDILHKDTLIPKLSLQEKMDTHLVWLHYFQIRATLMRPEILADLWKGNTAYELPIASDDPSSKHKFSVIYRILLQMETKVDTSNIEIWERDCKFSFPKPLRDKLHLTSMTITRVIPLKLQGIKLLYRWYITPSRLHKTKLIKK